MTSLFPFVKKKTELFLRIISLAHVPVNVTDFSIGSIHCNPNNADRGRSIIRVTLKGMLVLIQSLKLSIVPNAAGPESRGHPRTAFANILMSN